MAVTGRETGAQRQAEYSEKTSTVTNSSAITWKMSHFNGKITEPHLWIYQIMIKLLRLFLGRSSYIMLRFKDRMDNHRIKQEERNIMCVLPGMFNHSFLPISVSVSSYNHPVT